MSTEIRLVAITSDELRRVREEWSLLLSRVAGAAPIPYAMRSLLDRLASAPLLKSDEWRAMNYAAGSLLNLSPEEVIDQLGKDTANAAWNARAAIVRAFEGRT